MTSIIIVVGFVNRDTEVLKERKGSRGYPGWTDWMPHAHWYGIALPRLHGRFRLPHVCGSCLSACPAALRTPAPPHPGLSPRPASSLVDTKRHPAGAGPQGLLPHPLLHAKFAEMFSWLPPAAASKAHRLNVSRPPHPTPQSELWLHLTFLSEPLLDKSTPRENTGEPRICGPSSFVHCS